MFLVVYTTVKNEKDADTIAKILVMEKLAACVNYFPVISMYRWKNKMEKTKEVMLMCKTTGKNLKRLKKRIKEIHPYEIPEVITVKIYGGDKKFLDWVTDSVGCSA